MAASIPFQKSPQSEKRSEMEEEQNMCDNIQKRIVHLELLMRAADILTPLHISLDHLNPGSQNLVLVTGSRVQVAMFVLACAHASTAMARCKHLSVQLPSIGATTQMSELNFYRNGFLSRFS